MPASNIWAGLAAFLDSAGGSAQKITRQYQQDVLDADEKKKKDILFNQEQAKKIRERGAKVTGGTKIRSAMQALMNPMDPEAAADHLDNADPQTVETAADTIKDVTTKVHTALPKQSRRQQENAVKNAMRTAIAEQESTGTDIGEHPRAANGLQAFGKYGIVPEYHIDKVGLDPRKPADIERWKKDSTLQEATFDRIIDENYKTAGGDVDKALELYYGKAKNKDAKQHLADGRTMPSVNEYVAQVKSRMNGVTGPGRDSLEKTAGNARAAIDSLVSTDFKAPSKSKVQRNEATLGKLYATMDPDEIEQNKDYLDKVAGLAASGREDYREELSTYQNNLNRQTTAAMNAMKLDEQTQIALAKIKSGVKSLTTEEVRALESRRKLLESMRSQITDFTTRVGGAKPGARESILKTRPDLSGIEEPGMLGRVFGQKGKPVIDDSKIQKKLDVIDRMMIETDRALAGLGGLERQSDDEMTSDEDALLSRPPGGVSPLSKYLIPVKK